MNLSYTHVPFADVLRRVEATLPHDMPIYLVGGAVRDYLLNRPTNDLDFTVPRDAISASRRVANALGAAFFPIDPERDTGRVLFTDPAGKRLILDFASYRGPDLESDLRDRDFTINAMAINLHEPHSVFDPLGGANDLRKGVLRACSETAFSSDPIRVIRGVRLAADLGFKILPETRKAIHKELSGLSRISPERLRDELFRILDGPRPASVLRALDFLGVLAYILPELTALQGLTQSPPHIADIWNHTLDTVQKLTKVLNLMALEQASESASNWAMGLISLRLGRYRQDLHAHLNAHLNPDRSLRALLHLAALYHDVGKPATRQVSEGGSIHFLEHERVSTQLVIQRGEALRLSNLEIERLGLIVHNHMRPLFLTQASDLPSRRAIYRFFRSCKEAGVDVCLLALADTLATYGPSLPEDVWMHQLEVTRTLLEAWWEQKQEQIAPPVLLNGNDILQIFNLKPGPQIGRLLEALREFQAAGEIHDYQEALEFAQTWLKEN